jgi:DNA invertase Pin-like site-specific DNA recombinase
MGNNKVRVAIYARVSTTDQNPERPEKDPSAAGRIASLREEGLSLRETTRKENLTAVGVLKILRRQTTGR